VRIVTGKPSIAVLSTGEIVISFIRNYGLFEKREAMEVIRSNDGGRTFSDPIPVTRSHYNDREGYLIRFPDDTLLLCYMRVMIEEEPERPWQGPYLWPVRSGLARWPEISASSPLSWAIRGWWKG
jgi:hypothetical protein